MRQAVLIEPQKVIIQDVPKPKPGPGQVLIQVRRIGVCGSDIHAYYGKHPYISCPIVQGHEFAGRISEVGPGVRMLKTGDDVTVMPQLVCGECYPCRQGNYHICNSLKVIGCQAEGAAQEFLAVDQDLVVKLPAGLGYDSGAMVEPVAVGAHAVGRLGNVEGKNVLVIGAGPIGNLTAQVAGGLGAAAVAISDLSDFRLEVARACGIPHAINPAACDLASAAQEAFAPDGADAILECVGAEETVGQAISLARKGTDIVIVVQFDDTPVRAVFWRGTRYSPAWVMENGMWMADQSIENFNDNDGCIEHMLDPRCLFSHVRIVENTEARVVVHWRYCPTSANGDHSQVDPVTGWEDWVDEYYTFYPDAVGLRKVILHTKGDFLWPEEVILLCHPGQRPEDVVDLAAMTLVNLKGQSHTYSWAEKTPEVREGDKYLHFGGAPDEKPVIMRVNMMSEIKPFQVFETGNRFSIFAGEHRKEASHFPWWNHWPVAQIPSDGRYCQAADMASHFSLAWGGPPPHDAGDGTFWWAWMYGATKGSAEALVPLARSWLQPPDAVVKSGNVGARYDLTQRCYVFKPKSANNGIGFRLEAKPGSPIVHPAFFVENWGNKNVRLKVNGQEIKRGKDFRFGHVRRVNQYDLVVWLRLDTEQPVTIDLTPVSPDD